VSTDGLNYTFTDFSEIFESLVPNGFEIQYGAIVSFDGTKFFLSATLYDGSQSATYPVYTSEDGVSWTLFETNGLQPHFGALSFIVFDEKLFLTANFASGAAAADYGLAVFDAEESSWSRISLPEGNWAPWLITKQDEVYMLPGRNQGLDYLTSTDLVTWTIRSFPSPLFSFYASAVESYGPYVYVSGYNDGTLLRSSNVSDPSTWENLEPQTPFAIFGFDSLNFFSFEEKIFIKYGGTNSFYAYSSNYGNTWTLGQLPDNIVPGFYSKKPDTRSTAFSLSASQTIIPTRSIEPNVVDEIIGGITLSEGDQIRIYSESPDLIAQVYGVEIA
jgi:hypothetical protein